MVDRTRRSLVLGGASLSLAGCCTTQSQLVSGVCFTGTSNLISGKEAQVAWSRPERYFDAHTHFFNAADVPVAGFLAKSVAHSVEDARLRELVIALAPVVEFIAKALAPTPAAEMSMLCDTSAQKLSLTAAAATSDLDRGIADNQAQLAAALFTEIQRRDTPIPAIVNEVVQRSRGTTLLKSTPAAQAGFSLAFVRDSVQNGAGPTDTKGRTSANDFGLMASERRLASIQSAFQFVGHMLAPRHHNLRTFIKKYAAGSPSVPLSGCFSAMVDFGYWLDCPGKASSMRDQVIVQEQMAAMSNGFMLPLVAYNPWVDIKENDASLETVRWAVEEHGCVGVKIYPPMGFYPFGNKSISLPSGEPRPELGLLDEKLRNFYALCAELDIPVMAHANESNGRDAAHDKLAGAVGWAALDAEPGIKPLYVNAGHFGGAEAHADGDWTADFVKLMASSTKLNLYGDLGFWDELATSSAARGRLEGALKVPLVAGTTVADRVMYGSDWHMLAQVPGWEKYAEDVAAVLRSFDASGSVADKVLGSNVLRLYGLEKGSTRQNLRRLKAHYSHSGRKLPGWMT